MEQTIISEQQFDDVYKPQTNHLDDNAGWNGCLYETFGEEEEYVLSLVGKGGGKRVWTLIDGDEEMVISAGLHFVNRLGYFITEKEWETGLEEVPQDMDF